MKSITSLQVIIVEKQAMGRNALQTCDKKN